MFRRLLSWILIGGALGLSFGLALGVGSIAYNAFTYHNKKDKGKSEFSYVNYGNAAEANNPYDLG